MKTVSYIGRPDRQADIDGIAAENARKALCYDQRHAHLPERDRRLLAGGAAAEVAPRHKDAARLKDRFKIQTCQTSHGEFSKLIHRLGHRIAGKNLVGIHVVPQNDYFSFDDIHSQPSAFGTVILPASAVAAAVAGEAR